MSRRCSIILLLFPAMLLHSGCGQPAGDELSFVERSSEGAGSDYQDESTNQVVISGQQQQLVKLLVLPFGTSSRDPRLALFIRGLPGVLKKMFDKDRFISADTIDQEAYRLLARKARGRGVPASEKSIAEAVYAEFGADLILYGRIEIEEKKVVIEPKLMSFDGETGVEEELPRMEVSLSNIMHFVNPLTENIKDRLSQRQR